MRHLFFVKVTVEGELVSICIRSKNMRKPHWEQILAAFLERNLLEKAILAHHYFSFYRYALCMHALFDSSKLQYAIINNPTEMVQET